MKAKAYCDSSIPIFPLANATTSTAWLDTTHPLNGQTTIIYNVPGTKTRLIINVWPDELPEKAMSSVVLRTMSYAATHIEAKGDGTIEPKEDPFWLDSNGGVIFGLWSTDDRRHLSYSELESVARGLWTALFMKKKYNSASVSVFDNVYTSGRTRLGYGVIRVGHLKASVSDT